jgi:membrane protein YqaA with SNARE-associated domain
MIDDEKKVIAAHTPHSYPKPRNPLRRLYNWVLHWADTPYGVPALFVLAFAESSFFPIPPDVLLLALALSIPSKAFRYALICSAGSVMGAVLGYVIGYGLWDAVGMHIVNFYNLQKELAIVTKNFETNEFVYVWLAGFTPIPYKVFTIASGVFEREGGGRMFSGGFWTMLLASACSRPLRFFFVGGLIWKFGKPIGAFIHKYFNLVTLALGVLAVLGFLAIKFL